MSGPFHTLDGEMFLVRRLNNRAVFVGLTDPPIRRERARKAIIEAGLDCTIVGRNAAGKVERYGELFERIYSEPLFPPADEESP